VWPARGLEPLLAPWLEDSRQEYRNHTALVVSNADENVVNILQKGSSELHFKSYLLKFFFGSFLCLFGFSYSFGIGSFTVIDTTRYVDTTRSFLFVV
jgi:hypothetical protein